MNRLLTGVSLIILIGWALAQAASDVSGRQLLDGKPAGRLPRGPVRADRHAVADADGPFNALGATLFWGVWGYKFDRDRLERNLAALSEAGVDYVRVLGSVGGSSWSDRQVDPQWPDYDEVVGAFTDLAYDKYGLRVQWTLFGGAPFTPPGRARRALVDRFAVLARGREHKIFAFEIANEAGSNGFDGSAGITELRGLGARLSGKTAVLVALSDPDARAECATYAGARVDAATWHYRRGFGDDGPWRPVRAPWGYPAEYDTDCRGQLPTLVLNNEPLGPESSVRQDDDPARIAAAYILTFLANHGAYVFHAGPGIRGGGTADVDGSLRRHANFDELPSFTGIASALKTARNYLPEGLANWARHGPKAASAPLTGPEHVYAATRGSDFVVLVLDLEKAVQMRVRALSSIVIRNVATGRVVKRLNAPGGRDLHDRWLRSSRDHRSHVIPRASMLPLPVSRYASTRASAVDTSTSATQPRQHLSSIPQIQQSSRGIGHGRAGRSIQD